MEVVRLSKKAPGFVPLQESLVSYGFLSCIANIFSELYYDFLLLPIFSSSTATGLFSTVLVNPTPPVHLLAKRDERLKQETSEVNKTLNSKQQAVALGLELSSKTSPRVRLSLC